MNGCWCIISVFTSFMVTHIFYCTRSWNKSNFNFRVSIAFIVNFIHFYLVRRLAVNALVIRMKVKTISIIFQINTWKIHLIISYKNKLSSSWRTILDKSYIYEVSCGQNDIIIHKIQSFQVDQMTQVTLPLTQEKQNINSNIIFWHCHEKH